MKPDLLFAGAYPLTHANPKVVRRLSSGSGLLAFIAGPPAWEDDCYYLQIEVDGFIGLYGGGNPMDRFDRQLKSFFGLGLALKLFDVREDFQSKSEQLRVIVHRLSDQGWLPENSLTLDADDSEVISGLILWNKFREEYPAHNRTPWLQSVLLRLSLTLTSSRAQTLKLAARWFFDSFKGRDEVLTYVRRMTCLEIVFGEHADTSKLSLGELIGNRLAYLIGKTHQERTAILNTFRAIYSVRSRILHHGKHRLSSEERTLLRKLKEFCERSLDEEAKLITAGDQQEAKAT